MAQIDLRDAWAANVARSEALTKARHEASAVHAEVLAGKPKRKTKPKSEPEGSE